MIANYFRKTNPANVLSSIVILFVVYAMFIFYSGNLELSIEPIVKQAAVFFCLILLMLVFNFIVQKNSLTQDNSYALLYVVLLFVAFPETLISAKLVIANLCLYFGFRKVYSLKSNLATKIKLFDAGFWLGIACIVSVWAVVYMLLIYAAVFIYQKASFKNLMVPIAGFSTPLFLYFTYLFYTDSLDVFYDTFMFNYNFDFSNYQSLKIFIPLLVFGIVSLWSIIKVVPRALSVSKSFKFSWNVILSQLFLSMIIVVVSPIKNGSELLFLFFPTATIITNYLQSRESSFTKNILLYGSFLFSIGIFVYNLIP